MAGKKKTPPASITRSSAAEYLTFVAAAGDASSAVEMRYENENIWLTQKMMAALYDVDVRTINEHLQKVFADGELVESEATVRNFRIVQSEGERQVSRNTKHYNLQTIIAVGFKVNNPRAVQFRKWAGQIVKDYTIQGWTMDVERLKSGHLFTNEFFDRQLALIREIRLSERKFYQKVTDLYATAFDYDSNALATREFFALVQNKLHWAVHRHTAAEMIVARADAGKQHMGLTSWAGAPSGKIVKTDVAIAKNYLSGEELEYLDGIRAGVGQDLLRKRIRVVFHERMRYFAQRIAQTELHRAYADRQAVELMADNDVIWVEFRLSLTHLRTDICDLWAKQDKYGLGPGVYPKALAPKVPCDPFCRCVVSPRLDIPADARSRPRLASERNYLRSIDDDEAARTMGGKARRDAVLKGQDAMKVVQSGVTVRQ